MQHIPKRRRDAIERAHPSGRVLRRLTAEHVAIDCASGFGTIVGVNESHVKVVALEWDPVSTGLLKMDRLILVPRNELGKHIQLQPSIATYEFNEHVENLEIAHVRDVQALVREIRRAKERRDVHVASVPSKVEIDAREKEKASFQVYIETVGSFERTMRYTVPCIIWPLVGQSVMVKFSASGRRTVLRRARIIFINEKQPHKYIIAMYVQSHTVASVYTLNTRDEVAIVHSDILGMLQVQCTSCGTLDCVDHTSFYITVES